MMHDQEYSPLEPWQPDAMAAFTKELQNAVTCCAAVQVTPWTHEEARDVVQRAQNEGTTTVKAVSKRSTASCSQPFMVFEAGSDDECKTYIIAFRADPEPCTEPGAFTPPVESEFQVHKALWERATSMPLQSLPPQWLVGLRERGDRLILTGYSIGGAVAALATLQLLETEDCAVRQQICCYTFGAPLQGDQKYADRINRSYRSHFYHVLIAGDPVPGVLTLVNKVCSSKVAGDKLIGRCADVVSGICTLAGITAIVATRTALDTLAPGAGSILVGSINPVVLWKKIRDLIRTVAKSSLPLWGGTLLQVKEDPRENISFIPSYGCDGFLKEVFSVNADEKTAKSVTNAGSRNIKTFLRIIKEAHVSTSSGLHNGASLHVNSKTPVVIVEEGETGCSFSPLHFRSTRPASKKSAWLLNPVFRSDETITVWLDQNAEHLNIEVNGENIVLGIHVLYLQGEEVKLRVPCMDNHRPFLMETNEPQQSMLSSTRFPLNFRVNLGTNILTFKDPDGVFKVELAFGLKTIPASSVTIRTFNPLEEIKVAERFASEPPQNLVNLLITSGVVSAQAKCHVAFSAIQKRPSDVNQIERENLENFSIPHEFVLLDHLLALADVSLLSSAVQEELPNDMFEALTDMLEAHTDQECRNGRMIPIYSAGDNRTAYWTFSECFERTTRPMFTKEMLSRKETGQELGRSLDIAFVGPKKVLNAFLDWKLEVKTYSKEYTIDSLREWKTEKEIVKLTTHAAAIIGATTAVAPAPLYWLGQKLDSSSIQLLATIIGAPTALVGGGLVASVWWLSHIALKPMRMLYHQPGLLDDLKLSVSSSNQLDDWDSKLHVAGMLNGLTFQAPYVACQLEFNLYEKAQQKGGIVQPAGFFDIEGKLPFDKSRYPLETALRMVNYGVAGAIMHAIRRHLTGLRTTVGLIGTSQAGKSCFAQQAFHVDSLFGPGLDSRTRVIRHWANIPLGPVDRSFAAIDFPGSTDEAEPDLYIRGLPLASVLLVIMKIDEMITTQAVTIILKACKARRKDKTVSILFCFTHADIRYEEWQDAKNVEQRKPNELFTESFASYKTELLHMLRNRGASDAELDYISSNMHSCCFAPKLQGKSKTIALNTMASELEAMEVKNVKWVRDWCVEKLKNLS